MRRVITVRTLEEARLLADAMLTENIETSISELDRGGFALWAHDDRHRDVVDAFLDRFYDDPNDPELIERASRAAEVRRTAAREDLELRKRSERVQKDLARVTTKPRIGTMTLGLIVLCVGVFGLTSMGTDKEALLPFFLVNLEFVKDAITWDVLWKTMQHGEVWRLLSPMLIHFGLMHLVFNLWWLKDLGTAIEHVHRTRFFFLLVLVLGVVSNLFEFACGMNPVYAHFFGPSGVGGGMSGVVYGLFGFIWMRARFDARPTFGMPKSTVALMLGWLVITMLGNAFQLSILPSIAHGAHIGGLLAGMAWGFMSATRLKPQQSE